MNSLNDDTPRTISPHLDSTHNDPRGIVPLNTPIRPNLIPGLTIVRPLGQGSSATVYLARGEEGEVAVKILATEYIDHDEVALRWERETATLVTLRHPNIVKGIRRGVAEGRPYLVMEFVLGETLSARLRRLGKFSESECLKTARAVLEALAAAGEKRMIHRDVKPANIIRAEDGAIKLTDFGLTRALDGETITLQGAMIGTPAFISPEQARGDHNLDPRTDLYSLGVTLFQLVTGEIPYSSLNTSLMLTKKITEDVPDVRSIRREVGGGLAYFIAALCNRDRELRPPSAADALKLLASVEAEDAPEDKYSSSIANAPRIGPISTDSIQTSDPLLQTVVTDKQLKRSTVHVAAGNVLFYEDDTSRECYILLNGEAEVLKAGRQVAVISEPGAFVGEMSALRKAPRSATIRATKGATFLRVAEEEFHSFLRRHPEMNYQLACALAARLERTTDKLTKAEARLARLNKHLQMLAIDLK